MKWRRWRWMRFSAPACRMRARWRKRRCRTPVAALVQNWAPWTMLFSLTRQPALSLPMGVDAAGLPTAVQIAAPLYRDDVLLRVARAVERGLG